MATPAKRARVLEEEDASKKKRGAAQQQLPTKALLGEEESTATKKRRGTAMPGRGDRGSSLKKRRKKKEEEWNRVVAKNHSIRAYLMPRRPSSEGGRGVLEQETTEMRSRIRDTGEEERNREEVVSPAVNLQAKMCGEMNTKVSNTVTNVNLCVDRVKEGVWVAGPGDITRDTAVCEEDDDDVGVVGRHRRVGRINKEDIPPCTHQGQIHQGNNCLRVETDTADSVLASCSKLMTEPDRKKYYR